MVSEKAQHIDRIMYKFDIYDSWFEKHTLETMENHEISDLIGFCLDVLESLQAIARENIGRDRD